MKRSLVALSLLAASAMLAPAAHADEDLKWMTGCWRTAAHKDWTEPCMRAVSFGASTPKGRFGSSVWLIALVGM